MSDFESGLSELENSLFVDRRILQLLELGVLCVNLRTCVTGRAHRGKLKQKICEVREQALCSREVSDSDSYLQKPLDLTNIGPASESRAVCDWKESVVVSVREAERRIRRCQTNLYLASNPSKKPNIEVNVRALYK